MNSFAVTAKLFGVMARTKDFDENEVLTRAMNVFWTRGYNSTSMEDLVSALGISRSSLYDTYTDKHTLFVKALKNYQKIGYDKILEIVNSHESAKEKIKKLIELAANGTSDDKNQAGCFMVNAGVEVAPHDKEVSRLVCMNDQQMEDIFYQVIQVGKRNGEIKSRQNTRLLARFIFNTVKGLQVTAKAISDKSAYNDIIKLAVTTFDQNI